MNIVGYVKSNRSLIIIISLAIVFFFLYSWLPYHSDGIFTSPDETANYFFINNFTENSSLTYSEPINLEVNGIIRPRSITSIEDNLVPGSFLGIILIFGFIAKIFSTNVILYLTPFFAVIGVIFFYLSLKEIFKEKIAFISSLFLFVLPTYWLYSSRGMFHNVLFLSLLIIGLYFLVKSIRTETIKKVNQYYLWSGLFIGLSLMIRTSELVWVGFLVLTIMIINYKKINFISLVLFLVPIFSLASIILYYNNLLYGSLFSFSYSREVVGSSGIGSSFEILLVKIKKLFLPFGFNLLQIKSSVYQYLILIFPWFSILWVLSILLYLKNIIFFKLNEIFPELKEYSRKYSNKEKVYFILYLLSALWLIIYYGSFEFTEYFDQSEPLLGSSYLRYWLPIYVFALPLCVGIVLKISSLFKNKNFCRGILMVIVFSFIFLSVDKVLLDPLYGIMKIKDELIANQSTLDSIIANSSEGDVIISGFSDKIFFPNRKVIVRLPLDKIVMTKNIYKLMEKNKVFLYYNPLDEYSVEALRAIEESENFILKKINIPLPGNHIFYKLQ